MPAADGELAALLGPVDPLVAGEGERLGEPVEAGLGADRRAGRAPAAPRAGGTPSATAVADAQTSPPGREHVERARPLADEVRRRLEPRAPADAAARQQRDALRRR